MSTLADLFPADSPGRGAPAAIDVERTAKRLEALTGPPRPPAPRAARARDDTAALIALVGARGRAASMSTLGSPSPPPRRIRRNPGARDWLSIVVAVVAVVAIIVAAVVAAVVASSASPATDSMRTLVVNEAELVEETLRVNDSIVDLDARIVTGRSAAEALAGALKNARPAVDASSLAAVARAREAYLRGLDEVRVPATRQAYARPVVDEESLASVGTALDAVSAFTSEVQLLAAELTAAQLTVTELDERFERSLGEFTAAVPPTAEQTIAENPDAFEEYRQDVTDAARALEGSSLLTAEGRDALKAYVDAVEALRADQRRAEEEIALLQELERQRQEELERQREEDARGGGSSEPTPTPTPTPEP